VLFSLNLVACTTNNAVDGNATNLVGTGPAIAQAVMPEYCQGAVAKKFYVSLNSISTLPAAAADGGFEVKGNTTEGDTRVFNCRFDSSGRFVGVMTGISAS
jgi:hypothetical protein